ncbi:MAG: bifunctional DNA-formamidopyrimidine glycosylase/DNA-(apurinic or apyrimidinic site) lyase [Gemmatimonadota bacterium]
MPELPEVETVVRQLAEALPGNRIRNVEIIHPDLIHEPSDSFRRALLGSTIGSVARRGKNILLTLSGPSLLVVNLGMTGRLLFAPLRAGSRFGSRGTSHEDRPPHLAIILTLDPQGLLLYADPRRFGSLRRYSLPEWKNESARLGPEPFDPELTPEDFHQRLARSRSPIRSWLLDQTKIAGVGNIYASEALFRARIHPKRPAQSIDERGSAYLLEAIRNVLSEAIQARGTTLRDYRTASGDRGDFEPHLQAYGRESVPCPGCNTPIVRVVFGNRSAFFCPRCQPTK